MTDKLVTHDDLAILKSLRAAVGTPEAELLDRLIAAAEADQPPLPEGWVLVPYPDGSHGVWWYSGHGDRLTRYDDGGGGTIDMASVDIRHKVTPLRPTVTEADVERAADHARRTYTEGGQAWEFIAGSTRQKWISVARAAFTTAGIEVQP